jgi:hypothetical protein
VILRGLGSVGSALGAPRKIVLPPITIYGKLPKAGAAAGAASSPESAPPWYKRPIVLAAIGLLGGVAYYLTTRKGGRSRRPLGATAAA